MTITQETIDELRIRAKTPHARFLVDEINDLYTFVGKRPPRILHGTNISYSTNGVEILGPILDLAERQLSTEQEKGDAWLDKVLSAPLPTTPQAEPELVSEIARLKEECDKARSGAQQQERLCNTERNIKRKHAAEIARLREALEEIANGDGTYGAQAFEYKQIARKALQGEGSDSTPQPPQA